MQDGFFSLIALEPFTRATFREIPKVGWAGLEPATNALKGRCSTIELPTRSCQRSGATKARCRVTQAGNEVSRPPFTMTLAAKAASLRDPDGLPETFKIRAAENPSPRAVRRGRGRHRVEVAGDRDVDFSPTTGDHDSATRVRSSERALALLQWHRAAVAGETAARTSHRGGPGSCEFAPTRIHSGTAKSEAFPAA